MVYIYSHFMTKILSWVQRHPFGFLMPVSQCVCYVRVNSQWHGDAIIADHVEGYDISFDIVYLSLFSNHTEMYQFFFT